MSGSILQDKKHQAGLRSTEDAHQATLDPETIAKLKSYGDEFVAELVGLYLKQLDLRLAEICLAVDGQRAAELRESAHALKGSSANLGAARMLGLCSQLELAARSGDLTAAPALFDEIQREAQAVRDALHNLS